MNFHKFSSILIRILKRSKFQSALESRAREMARSGQTRNDIKTYESVHVSVVKPGLYTYDASISINTSVSTRNLRVNRCDASISALCFRLCLCFRRPSLHVRHKHKRMKRFPFSCACACACVVGVNWDDASISTSARKEN